MDMPEPTEPHIEVISWEYANALRAIRPEERLVLAMEITDLTARIMKNIIADELQDTAHAVVQAELIRRVESGAADELFRQLFQDRIGFVGETTKKVRHPAPEFREATPAVVS
jgi:hypothetical protein